MTEDDTFRVLSRIPLSEMRSKYIELLNDRGGVVSLERIKVLLERHNWTIEELPSILKGMV